MKFRSLRVRLALWALLLLGTAQLVIGFWFYSSSTVWLEGQVDHTLLVTASQVATVLSEDGEPLEAEDFNFQFDRGNRVMQTLLRDQLFFVRLVDRQTGAVIESSASDELPITPHSQATTGNYETIALLRDGAAHEIRVYTTPLPLDTPLNLQVGISLQEVRETQAQILRSLALGFAVIAALALGSGWFLATRALIPIRATARTAASINETDLTRRLDLTASEVELAQLVQTFNAMLDRIERAFQRQRQFTADAAHELRTPLSIMQTGLDVTLSQERDAAQYRGALQSVRDEVQRLSQLANTLLMLARADAHDLPLVKQPVNLSLLLNTVTDQFDALAEDKGIRVEREIASDLSVQGDEDRLIQVMLNLLDNAIKYTPEGGKVRVVARRDHSDVQVVISDTGPGIPATEQPHIFDRFYRVDRARSRQQGGLGLGLAIAKQIVEHHHGAIQVISEPGQGAQFVVTLPAHKDLTAV